MNQRQEAKEGISITVLRELSGDCVLFQFLEDGFPNSISCSVSETPLFLLPLLEIIVRSTVKVVTYWLRTMVGEGVKMFIQNVLCEASYFPEF